MARNNFDQFSGGLTDEELIVLLRLAEKRRTIYLIGWIISLVVFLVFGTFNEYYETVPGGETMFIVMLIPAVIGVLGMAIFSGLGAFTHNVCCYISSRGTRESGGWVSNLWAFFGGIVLGAFIAGILNKTFPTNVLGWK